MAEPLMVTTSGKKIWGFHPNVFFLGMVSLLTDVSSELIFTLLPLFLANVLLLPITIVGLVGGLSDSTEAVFRILSGWLSDKIGKRKPLAVLGYGLATLAKPFMLVAGNWAAVLAVRISDRVGKGIRSAPRDALVADSVAANQRGRGFGLHRAMDTSGAFLGLAIAAIIIYLTQGGALDLTKATYRSLVVVGIIPAVLAVLVLLIFVRERTKKPPPGSTSQSSALAGVKAGFDARFKVFLAIIALFTLGNSSDFFVILRAQNLQAPLVQVTLMLVLFNATYAATALPMGILSDRLGRRRVIALGWFIYALAYLGFALASTIWQIWLLFGLYGIYYGVVEGVAKAFVADMVGAGKRGTAYGLYNGLVALILLPASLIAGWLWHSISPAAPFYFGAGLAFVAMLGITVFIKE